MHTPSFVSVLVVLSDCLFLSQASPMHRSEQSKQTHRLQQVEVRVPRRHVAEDLQRAYRKHNIAIPTEVAAAVAAKQSGGVQAIPRDDYGSAFYVPVKVGNTNMMLNFDTGSSDFWVFSKSLPSAIKGNHSIYPNSGQLLKGQKWDISYLDGSEAAGVVYADKVVAGSLTATKQAVEAATSISTAGTFLYADDQDGLVGLGFGTGNTVSPTQQKTFFESIKDTLPKTLFTATLRKGAPGEYDFGFIDPKKYTGSIAYVDVDYYYSQWMFNLENYAIGSGPKTSTYQSAIADTGTTLILMDDDTLRAYYAKVPKATYDPAWGYIYPCTANATMPSFSIYIGTEKRTAPGNYMTWGNLNDTHCVGGMQSNNGAGFVILGDIFLKSQFVVHQYRPGIYGWGMSPRLGFAQQANLTTAL